MLMWQNYTGPISIPLDRVKDVWIKYKLDNKEVIIPPAGTLLVDIVPDKTGYAKVPGVKVNINFDETATVKEYRVGDSSWMQYTGQFNVTENCIIEARARKTETIYNTDGTVLATRNIAGRDLVYISNIGVEETQLEAPTIVRLPALGTEKARLQVTYPANANKKIYKVNYGTEENYEAEISVENYGTYIIAYYYDVNGKRSKSSSILINDTSSGETAQQPKPYDPTIVPTPKIDIPAPIVVVNPTGIVEEVQVSINSPANADKVYVKLGRYGDYQLYTTPITIRENMDIYAYYRTYMGEKSDIGYGRVANIKEYNKPYVRIDADPYPYSWGYGASEVNVTINYSDTTTIEYSEDGVVFTTYTKPFKVTENKTIYARGTNSYGVTETSLNITNIGKIKAPAPMGNLSVGINVNPEPTVSTTRFAKATVSIDYDAKATEKYYRIGTFGELKPYTGAFEVTSNCTIYAIAKGVNAVGQTSKRIDNLSSGIAQPIISTVPGSREQASKVSVTIEYDKYSKIQRYSIDGGSLRDYSSPFEVTKNGTVIYAYSENDLGHKSEASYTINNIVPKPPTLLLDKGHYYILKLNYPEGSKNREYKWKENGTWGQYNETGILLIKPQYKDQLIQNGSLIKIQDESGNLITFTGDYYFIDVPISELSENLFMRWDREPLGAPQIIIAPSEPALQVTANIVYNPSLIKKQHKVINPDGSVKTDWTDYTGAITIDRNNFVVYAKGMDDTEVWTADAMKKVTNIDENQPIITLTADLTTAQQKVAVKVSVTDDVGVGKVKWASGIKGESYFTNSGTEIQNNSIVNITSNGYYTFYAEDQVGNKQVYTLNVTNVDLTAPTIDITVSPETTVGLTANVTIDYGDSVTKQYKVGTSNLTWSNYTNTFEISSYTILANNWQNADGTVTIYAKGKDAANNEITVQKKVLSLDLDKPNNPIINSNSTYAILYEYGAKLDATTTITFDSRKDIDNYYSIDNGATWLNYTGQFEITSGTVIAKSIKRSTGLEVSTSQAIAIPADALKQEAYDNNDTTAAVNGWIKIDNSMIEKTIRIKLYYCHISFYVSDKTTLIQNTTYDTGADITLKIPQNASWIKVAANRGGGGLIYEIGPSNEPNFNITTKYMSLNVDESKAVKEPYQIAKINYYTTSIQRLYRIGTSGDWINYNDQPITLREGETIYAKGVDKYGNETRMISSYTVNITDALRKEAYDKNDATYAVGGWIQVDSSMIEKIIRIKLYYCHISFYASDKTTLIQNVTYDTSTDITLTVPQNSAWIKVAANRSGGGRIYEIGPANEPKFNVTTKYLNLNIDESKAVKEPYQLASINYFPTSIQRLYRVGASGDWINYNDQPIAIKEGETIYAKGIDKYGNETRIISSYTATLTDALRKEAYDNNDATYAVGGWVQLDNSMIGKKVRIKLYYCHISFYALDKTTLIQNVTYDTGTDITLTVPQDSAWIKVAANRSGGGRVYEIGPSM